MTMTRRGFLKLAAAGAAVAIVPVQVIEAIAPLSAPTKPTEVIGRRLWSVIGFDEPPRDFRGYAPAHRCVDVTLAAGSCRIELGMYVDPSTSIDFFAINEIELDVRMVDGKPRVFIDDEIAEGVHRFSLGVEYPTYQFSSWSDDMVHTVVGRVDTEPLKQLSAYKQLRGGKP